MANTAFTQHIQLDGLTNAVTGQNMFLEEHEYPAYMGLGAQYMQELRPVGVRETQLAQKVIDLNWRLNTISAVENNLFHSSRIDAISPHDENEQRVIGMTSKANAWRNDCAGPNAFEKLGRHEMRVQRTLARLTAELERFQALRLRQGPDTFTLAGCKAWVWYDGMLARHAALAAERLAARAAASVSPETPAPDAASPSPATTSGSELLCKKPPATSPDDFVRVATPMLQYAAAHGLLSPAELQILDRCQFNR